MSFLSLRSAKGATETRMDADFARESDTRAVASSFAGTGLLGRCANSGCRSGWIHLFRKRSIPMFEDGWTCSPECTEAMLRGALHREMSGRQPAREIHHHRIPLGLLMMEQGWITGKQLRDALDAQKSAGSGRLGDWLVQLNTADEATVTRALGMQWSCPVFRAENAGYSSLTAVMPRLFVDAFGVLPLRVTAGRLLYLGFEQSPDPVLAFAVGRMMGMRVESAIVPTSVFHKAHRAMLAEEFATVQLAEPVPEDAVAHYMAQLIERHQPANARLVRVHDCLWLRMWLGRDTKAVPHIRSISDVVCSIGSA